MDAILGISITNLVGMAWLQATDIGLLSGAITLGWFVLTPLFAIRAWRAAAAGRGGDVSGFLIRFIIVGALLTSMPWIQDQFARNWVQAYAWGSSAALNLINNPSQDLQDGMNALTGGSDFATALTAVLTLATGEDRDALRGLGTSTAAVAAGGALGNNALSRTVFRWFTRAARFVLVPIMLFFVILLFISALTSLIAAILLPVALPFLLTPVGGGLVAGLISRTIASLGAVIALPLIFAVAVNLGVLMPLTTFINNFNDALDAFQGTGDGPAWGETFMTNLLRPFGVYADVAEFWGGSPMASVENFLGGVVGLADTFVFGVLSLIVGIIAAIVIVAAISQIFERLLGTIMVAGKTPGIGSGALFMPSRGASRPSGGGGPPGPPSGGPPEPRPTIAGGARGGTLNEPVPQPSAVGARRIQPLNTSPDATPDAEV